VRVMMMIKGDREPGHLSSEEFLPKWASTTRNCRRPACSWTSPRSTGAPRRSGQVLRRQAHRGRRPFGEAKEIVAGYWILQVHSMDEAIEWAKRLPFEAGGEPEVEGEIEIRQLFELEEFGESPAVE
jgi:hypothetical protein